MINQAAKRILKALSFDGVEVDAFRHMADLKRLDPMKIFYKKIDEKIYNGSHAVPVRIFFPNEKSFQESNDKTSDSRDKKLLLFVHGGGWVTESIREKKRRTVLRPIRRCILSSERKFRWKEGKRMSCGSAAGRKKDPVSVCIV